jgi:hypothetical protein
VLKHLHKYDETSVCILLGLPLEADAYLLVDVTVRLQVVAPLLQDSQASAKGLRSGGPYLVFVVPERNPDEVEEVFTPGLQFRVKL